MRYKTHRYEHYLEVLQNEFHQKKKYDESKGENEMKITEKFRYILRLFFQVPKEREVSKGDSSASKRIEG